MRRLDALTLKRLQRAAEYAMLAAMHVFFLLSFRAFFSWPMALGLGLATFVMNFQLTQLREQRRLYSRRNRRKLVADTVESILFLMLVVALSFGGLVRTWLDVPYTEYLGYVAAILGGLFLAGLTGEIYWQLRNLASLPEEQMRNYGENLQRTIIFPYFSRPPRQP